MRKYFYCVFYQKVKDQKVKGHHWPVNWHVIIEVFVVTLQQMSSSGLSEDGAAPMTLYNIT